MSGNKKEDEMICALTADEHAALQTGLDALPDTMPPRVVWQRIREQADNGHPTVAAMEDSQISAMYRSIARKTAARLANKARDHSSAFPNIVIQNT